MGRVHQAFHADARHGTQHRDRRNYHCVLPDRRIYRTYVAPATLAFLDDRLPTFRRLTDLFIGQIDSGAFVVFEGLDHLDHSLDLHFQREPIVISITRMRDRVRKGWRTVATHAAGEFIPDLDPAAARHV